MSEENVSYGKEPKYKIGEKVKFVLWGKLVGGEIVKYEPDSYYGLNYTIMDDINGGLHALTEEDINPTPTSPYEISYIADKPMETPEHYKMAIEPIEIIQKNGLGFIEGNILKYLLRWRKKGGKSDLLKIKHYMDLLLQYEFPEEVGNVE